MALSGCGQEDPFRKKTDVQKSLGPVLAKWNWPASSFLHPIRFRSFTDGPDHTVRNRPRSDLVPDGCQVVAKLIQSRRKPVCKNHPALFWQNETGPLPVSNIRFGSVLPKTARIILCKTGPDHTHARTDTDRDYHLFVKFYICSNKLQRFVAAAVQHVPCAFLGHRGRFCQ